SNETRCFAKQLEKRSNNREWVNTPGDRIAGPAAFGSKGTYLLIESRFSFLINPWRLSPKSWAAFCLFPPHSRRASSISRRSNCSTATGKERVYTTSSGSAWLFFRRDRSGRPDDLH